MKVRLHFGRERWASSRAFFVIFKLPALLATALLGFVIEFLYELPFLAVCLLSCRFKKKVK